MRRVSGPVREPRGQAPQKLRASVSPPVKREAGSWELSPVGVEHAPGAGPAVGAHPRLALSSHSREATTSPWPGSVLLRTRFHLVNVSAATGLCAAEA